MLDVENKGPVLNAGAFAMRITNIGSIGNPFETVGRSFDPSFEYPRGSGIEGLKSADLWVGASLADGTHRVSGGPLLEWRPTLAASDHVRTVYGGTPGTQRYFDDDGDGRIDEERLNGKDDDGDGEVDEDLNVPSTQMLAAEYADDQPEALAYGYPNGEAHRPLNLDVYQEAYAWAQPGYDRIAGLHFVIHNHGSETLHDVRIGLLADLDSRAAGESNGHVNDLIQFVHYAMPYNDGNSRVDNAILFLDPPLAPTTFNKPCTGMLEGDAPVVTDGNPSSGLPAFGIIPLRHTVDPLAQMEKDGLIDNRVAPFETAPASVSFQYKVFAQDLPPGQGGLPLVDADRYAAMVGTYPGAPNFTTPHDYAVLVSCGPFQQLLPGASYEFDVALVCGANPDSVRNAMELAALVHHGNWVNLYPDTSSQFVFLNGYGKSGFTGSETYMDVPPGVSFLADQHCWAKFPQPPYPIDYPIVQTPFVHGRPIWTDADCDACTGFNGNETHAWWIDPSAVPPSPDFHASPGVRGISILWDDQPEATLAAGISGVKGAQFVGYNVYRLSDWHRKGLMPGPEQFQLIAAYAADTSQGGQPLTLATDTTVAYDRVMYGHRVHPLGRYRFDDLHVNNGFDYIYVVTTVAQTSQRLANGQPLIQRYESPILSNLDSLVTPHDAARPAAGLVHVVPNPYRGSVQWDRPPVPGDTFGRHLDFVGLPRAHATIHIYTLAGDLVQSLAHDGTSGDGEERWNLISRNGQDVVSGVYLFTVDSPLGHQVGRFVVIR